MVKICGLIFLLISSNCWAIKSILLEKRDVDGIKQIGLSFKKDKVVMTKNSNHFNLNSSGDLGLFSIRRDKEINKNISKLKNLQIRLKKMNMHYKSMGKSFNQIHPAGPHDKVIKIGEFVIPSHQKMYNQGYKLIKAIIKDQSKKQKDIVRYSFTKDGPTLIYIKDDKEMKTQHISLGFHCSKRESQYICPIEKYGTLEI